MKTFPHIIGALLAAIATCAAAPADGAEGLVAGKRAFDCKDKLVVIAFSKYSSLASSLCSSYIRPTTTTEVVVSTSTPTPPTQITTTVPLTATITETVTETTPGAPITYYYNAPFPSNTKTILPTPPPAKRSAAPEPVDAKRDLPPWVAKYASKEISSACSCFSITPSTSTVASTSVTVAPTPTITATVSEIVTTTTVTSTTTVSGPRPTVSTCFDYQSSPLNSHYSWLAPSDLNIWSVQSFSFISLIDCCHRCYTTQNCISYRYYGTPAPFVYGCDLYTLPGNGALGNPSPLPQLVGYNAQCPLGVYKGTRQLSQGSQLAIGPCLDANYLN